MLQGSQRSPRREREGSERDRERSRTSENQATGDNGLVDRVSVCVDSIVQCVCLSALCVDHRSHAMCLFVKQIGFNIFMSFYVNN